MPWVASHHKGPGLMRSERSLFRRRVLALFLATLVTASIALWVVPRSRQHLSIEIIREEAAGPFELEVGVLLHDGEVTELFESLLQRDFGASLSISREGGRYVLIVQGNGSVSLTATRETPIVLQAADNPMTYRWSTRVPVTEGDPVQEEWMEARLVGSTNSPVAGLRIGFEGETWSGSSRCHAQNRFGAVLVLGEGWQTIRGISDRLCS